MTTPPNHPQITCDPGADPSSDAPAPHPGDSLLSALTAAAAELTEVTARLPACRVLAYRDSLPPGLVGAYVPLLTSNGDALMIGILSDACSCSELARLVDGSDYNSAIGMRTALSDLTRELARRLSRRLDTGARDALGAAVFVDGIARRSRHVKVRAAEVVFGIIRATLVLVGAEALLETDWPGSRRETRAKPEGA